MKRILVFSDLDGTLLGEADYAFIDARPALDLLHALQVPLVLCSSKTRAEIEVCRRLMGNKHPFISENGGGIFIPHDYFPQSFAATPLADYQLISLGLPYAEIRQHFVALRQQCSAQVRGFADMSVAEVARLTGLSELDAARAKQRDFDEPFVFDGPPDDHFLRAIEAAGLCWTQGRIFHLLGKHDKGRAVDILLSLYQQHFGEVCSIGLGDGLNDLPMLQTVDYPVLVRHPNELFETRLSVSNLMRTQLVGPAGWNQAVPSLLMQQLLTAFFTAALAAVDPYQALLNSVKLTAQHLQVGAVTYALNHFERIVIIGAGKATARMAQAMEQLLGKQIDSGLIIVKYDHTQPLTAIQQVEAAHPVPDAAGIEGAKRMLAMLQDVDEKTLVICLLSGGASALLVAPVEAITLEDKQRTTQLLLRAGASIAELNAVRKHLSLVKGGQLAQAVYPASLLTLILSDVIDDPLDVIASGPTTADASTFNDALQVVTRYQLAEQLPVRVLEYLQQGAAGLAPETVKQQAACLATTHNHIIASIAHALSAAQRQAEQAGFATRIVSHRLQGEARHKAQQLAQQAFAELSQMQAGERRCLLYGGETTVTVTGTGKGGRNQEFALAFALSIAGCSGISFLSAGTDGSDGPTDAAGGMVDGNTVPQALAAGLDPQHFLDSNDAYHFFQLLDQRAGTHCHIKTGPTGTNVMDIQIVLLYAGGQRDSSSQV